MKSLLQLEQVNADDLLVTDNKLSQQILDLICEDHAIQDVLYTLNKALEDDVIELGMYVYIYIYINCEKNCEKMVQIGAKSNKNESIWSKNEQKMNQFGAKTSKK